MGRATGRRKERERDGETEMFVSRYLLKLSPLNSLLIQVVCHVFLSLVNSLFKGGRYTSPVAESNDRKDIQAFNKTDGLQKAATRSSPHHLKSILTVANTRRIQDPPDVG